MSNGLPNGYALTAKQTGEDVHTGASARADVSVFTYTQRGKSYSEQTRTAIEVTRWPRPNAVLPATETAKGSSVNSGIASTTARYFDGWWSYASDSTSGETTEDIIWSHAVRSVTVTNDEKTLAVRGASELDVEALLKIAKSHWDE
jgi:hypothetical protein